MSTSPRGCHVRGHAIHRVPAVIGRGSTRDSPGSIPHNIMHISRSRRSGHAVEVIIAPGSRLSGIADPVACGIVRPVLVAIGQTIVVAHASEEIEMRIVGIELGTQDRHELGRGQTTCS